METVRDRYQRAMSRPQEDMAVKLARLIKEAPSAAPQGSSPLLGSGAPGAVPGYQQPYTGLKNNLTLPPFEQPGGSLPMQNYMPQTMTEPHGVAGTPPPPAVQPQMTAPPAFQPAAMPASIEPVPQDVGGAGAIERLAQALARKQMAPWAVNEGNFSDQYGG